MFDYSSDGYTGRLFARYIIIPQLYAHTEYAFESFERCASVDPLVRKCTSTERELVPFLLVGGGRVGSIFCTFNTVFLSVFYRLLYSWEKMF